MAITHIDPFQINEQKRLIYRKIVAEVFKLFPDHKIGSVYLRSGCYKFTHGEPSETVEGNNIVKVHFGVITPPPFDPRSEVLKALFPDDTNKPQVIGSICITFDKLEAKILKLEIFVFGTENKPKFTEFANNNDDYYGYLTVITENSIDQYQPISLPIS